VTSNQSHNDLVTYLLRFPDPIVHTCTRQLATQQNVVETFKNLTNEKESAFSIMHKENVDFLPHFLSCKKKPYEKLHPLKPHYPTTKTQKTIHIQLLCN
jgi:hypothetical protein